MTGTINCVYETPCGWCSKWDKECDKKIAEPGNRAKCNSIDGIDGAMYEASREYIESMLANKVCKSEDDHEWECCGMSTEGSHYMCKKCGTHRMFPCNTGTLDVHLTTLNI